VKLTAFSYLDTHALVSRHDWFAAKLLLGYRECPRSRGWLCGSEPEEASLCPGRGTTP
jgi:hypothetical protein